MKFKQAAILESLGIGLVGAGAIGGAKLSHNGSTAMAAPAEDKHLHMHEAMRSLEEARKHMLEASDHYQCHRVKGVEHTAMAMDEIAAALGEKAPEHHKFKD